MAENFQDVFREAEGYRGELRHLHPRKLDRWHTGLVGLPDALYMQYGCGLLLQHVVVATASIQTLASVMGLENLPLKPQEIARRQIRRFTWHVASEHAESGTIEFALTWNSDTSAWQLTANEAPNTIKTVPDFETGVEKANEWAKTIKPEERENIDE